MINFAKIWDILITKFPAFMEGVEITLQLAFFTVLFGSLLGLVVAVCRRTRLLPLRWLMKAYVAFSRGTPLLVQVLLVVYGLPQLGIRLPRMTLCIIALVINSGAYMAELIRAGLQSVEKGQVEAAESLGMSSGQTMLYIILPQAVKNILPALGNEFIVLVKETAVVGYVAVQDLTKAANWIQTKTFQPLVPLLLSALIYLVLVMLMTWGLRKLERRLGKSDYR